jgi:hypothetical protein
MGGAVSFQGGVPNGSEVHNMLNVIMKEMFRRADLVDLYSLADPNRCSNYLVVAADSIKQLFKKINLEPRLGEKGVIYFQRLDTFKRQNPLGEESNKVCRQLSFFFIRIFHIYGALTLSIIDSELPRYDLDRELDRGGIVRPNSRKFLQGFEQPNRPGWFGRGGALVDAPIAPGGRGGAGSYYLTDRAGAYKILNRFLLVPDGAEAERDSSMIFDSYPSLTVAQEELYEFPAAAAAGAPAAPIRQVKYFNDINVERPKIDYSFRKPRGDGFDTITAKLELVRNGNDIDVRMDSFTSPGKHGNVPALTEKLTGRRPNDPSPVSSKDKDLPAVIVDLFKKAQDIFDPPKFSPVEFMQKFGLIRSLDANSVKIEGSSKLYMQSPREFLTRSSFVVEYTDKLKLGDRPQSVELMAEVSIDKRERSQYRVIVDLEGMQSDPEELIDYLDRRTRSYTTFSADINNPAVQPIGLEKAGETIPSFLEGVFTKMLKSFSGAERRETRNLVDDRGKPKPYDSQTLPEAFKVQRLWKALAKNPPVKSHCVARAMQLLNVSAIRDPASGEKYSSVCNVNFPYIKNNSLPTPGRDITGSEGIYATALLFVDTLGGPNFMPKVTNSPAFNEFKKTLRDSFERVASAAVPDNLSDIKDRMIPKCQGRGDRMEILDRGLSEFLRGKANELVRQQMQHVASVMRILFKLFDETELRRGGMKINTNILTTGMPALNALAEEARNLLIAYYSNCEKTYNEGLVRIQFSAPGATE